MNDNISYFSPSDPIDELPEDITIDEYQEAAVSFRRYSTDYSVVYPALGLAGECGEVAEKVKKILRDHNGVITEEQREAIRKELGDVFWYLANLTDDLGFHLSEVAWSNLEKLEGRVERGTIHGEGDNR